MKLNEIHCIDHGLRYWRVLLAPWLMCFVPIIFHRWESIKNALLSFDISDTIILDFNKSEFVLQGTHEINRILNGDEWNHFIFGLILKSMGFNSFRNKTIDKKNDYLENTYPSALWREKMKDMVGLITNSFSREKDSFLLGTYLTFFTEKKHEILLGQFPQYWTKPIIEKISVEYSQRNWSLDFPDNGAFERFLLSLIPKNIPVLYLEGYKKLINCTESLSWPKKPKMIFSANMLWWNPVAMAYTAEKIEKKSTLVYAQHGSTYGMMRNKWMEEHELKIADKYITWGWTEAEQSDLSSKISPIGVLKPIRRKRPSRRNAVNLLIVTVSGPRYVFRYEAGRDMPFYIRYCLSFVDNFVGSHIYQSMIIRLFPPAFPGNPSNYGWDEEQRWRDLHPNVVIDTGKKPLRKTENTAKLVVHTYSGSTAFLENIVSNIPCILLDMEELELYRENTIPYILELKRVGIYHHSTKSAAEHVKKIWEDVDAWWDSDVVQTVLKKFTNNYCKINKNQLFEIHKLLKNS